MARRLRDLRHSADLCSLPSEVLERLKAREHDILLVVHPGGRYPEPEIAKVLKAAESQGVPAGVLFRSAAEIRRHPTVGGAFAARLSTGKGELDFYLSAVARRPSARPGWALSSKVALVRVMKTTLITYRKCRCLEHNILLGLIAHYIASNPSPVDIAMLCKHAREIARWMRPEHRAMDQRRADYLALSRVLNKVKALGAAQGVAVVRDAREGQLQLSAMPAHSKKH